MVNSEGGGELLGHPHPWKGPQATWARSCSLHDRHWSGPQQQRRRDPSGRSCRPPHHPEHRRWLRLRRWWGANLMVFRIEVGGLEDSVRDARLHRQPIRLPMPMDSAESGIAGSIDMRTRWTTPARVAALAKLRCSSAIRGPSVEIRNTFSTSCNAASTLSGSSRSPTAISTHPPRIAALWPGLRTMALTNLGAPGRQHLDRFSSRSA